MDALLTCIALASWATLNLALLHSAREGCRGTVPGATAVSVEATHERPPSDPRSLDEAAALAGQTRSLLGRGNRVGAVYLLQEQTGAGWHEAAAVADAMARTLPAAR